MIKIPMNGKRGAGLFALIDEEDFELVSAYTWHVNAYGYAVCNHYVGGSKNAAGQYKQQVVFMHRLILGAPDGVLVDHKEDGERLDNRKENLRLCDKSQNGMNRGKPRHNTSGYKGVWWSSQSKKWATSLTINGKKFYFGFFADKLEAAKAYNKGALKHFGEFAQLNDLDGL